MSEKRTQPTDAQLERASLEARTGRDPDDPSKPGRPHAEIVASLGDDVVWDSSRIRFRRLEQGERRAG